MPHLSYWQRGKTNDPFSTYSWDLWFCRPLPYAPLLISFCDWAVQSCILTLCCFAPLNLYQTSTRYEETVHNIHGPNEPWHNNGFILFSVYHLIVSKLWGCKYWKVLNWCFHGAAYYIYIVIYYVPISVTFSRYHYWVVMVSSVVRAIIYMGRLGLCFFFSVSFITTDTEFSLLLYCPFSFLVPLFFYWPSSLLT